MKIAHDLRVVTLDSLLRLVYPISGVSSLVGYLLAILLVIGLWSIYFRFLKPDEASLSGWKVWPGPMIWLGLSALLLAGIPFMVTSLPVEVHFPNDRFTLPYIFGVCLLLVGLIELIPNRLWLKAGLLGALVGLSCGVQYQYGGQFVQDRQIQNDFLWQLQWRAPGIQPGTLIISEKLPHLYESDNSLTAAINWMYAPEFTGDPIPYLVSYGSVRLRTGKLKLEPDTPIVQDYRVAAFRGNSSQAMVVYNKLPGCVRILDPERDKWIPNLPNTILKALSLSRLDLVIADPEKAATPPMFLGKEPAHGWCYYFEKADLAASLKDWQRVAELGDQAQKEKLAPGVQAEWIVFIQGYALTGRWQEATELTRTTWKADPELKRPLCTAWGQIERRDGFRPGRGRRQAGSLLAWWAANNQSFQLYIFNEQVNHMAHSIQKFKHLKSDYAFQGRAFKLRRDYLRTPDGRDVIYEIIEHPGAVTIVPVDENHNILFIHQYRPATGRGDAGTSGRNAQPGRRPAGLCPPRSTGRDRHGCPADGSAG